MPAAPAGWTLARTNHAFDKASGVDAGYGDQSRRSAPWALAAEAAIGSTRGIWAIFAVLCRQSVFQVNRADVGKIGLPTRNPTETHEQTRVVMHERVQESLKILRFSRWSRRSQRSASRFECCQAHQLSELLIHVSFFAARIHRTSYPKCCDHPPLHGSQVASFRLRQRRSWWQRWAGICRRPDIMISSRVSSFGALPPSARNRRTSEVSVGQ